MSEPHDVARHRVAELLGEKARLLTFGDGDDELEIELAPASGLAAAQVGYAVTPSGESLLDPDGGWQSEWLIIGQETLLGDPVFVDLDEPALPVFMAMHDLPDWEPVLLAESLEAFLSAARE